MMFTPGTLVSAWDSIDCDRIVFVLYYAMSGYRHYSFEFNPGYM